MLEVKSSIPVMAFNLQIDDYIPITLECSNVSVPLPLYWRTGDFKKSLITVGLNPQNGAICSVVLAQIESLKRFTNNDFFSNIQYFLSGIPICEIANWDSSRYIDENDGFSVSLIDSSILIIFGEPVDVITQYQVKNIMFYVNANSCICALKLNDIQQADIKKIINSVRC